jgi:hypothetical protein
MPRLEPIGRVADPDDLDLEPVEIELIGYTSDKEEVSYLCQFRPVQPTGAAVELMRQINPDGDVPVSVVLAYLDAAVLDGTQEEWSEFINRPDIFIEQTALLSLYETIIEFYAARPTRQRSGSHNGRVTTAKTSRAAARSKAPTSTGSR